MVYGLSSMAYGLRFAVLDFDDDAPSISPHLSSSWRAALLICLKRSGPICTPPNHRLTTSV